MVNQVPDKAFWDSALAQADKLIVVEFYADWCESCKYIAPIIESMSETFQNVDFLEVNVENDECSIICKQHEIKDLPTFLLFKNGAVVERAESANEETIKRAIQNLL